MKEKKESIKDAWVKLKNNPDIEEKNFVKCLQSIKDDFQDERNMGLERTWKNNLAFYAGNHYVRDPISNQSTYKVRLRENHTNNTISRIISIVVQNLPIVKTFPASSSYIDVQNAESTEGYLKYFWRVQKLEEKIARLVKNTCIFGSGFGFRSWDPDAGEKITLYKDEIKGQEDVETMFNGDIKVDIDDPFKIFVRPGIEFIDDMHDFIRSVPTSRQAIEAKYGPVPSEPVKTMNVYTQRIRESDEIVMVNHYYHKPTPWFEEGLYACWVGTKLLKARPAKESERKLPLYHLPFDKNPMSFYGTSSIEQIMDLQEQLNRAASHIVEARNLISRPRVFASNEAKIAAQSLSDRPGEITRYALAGGPPQFVVPPFNFAEMANHKADLRNAIGQVSGITTASRGEIPSATKTALALQLVLEQDRSQYAPFIKSLFQVILDLAYGILYTAADYIDEDDPRTIKIEGVSSDSRLFHGKMVPSPLDLYLEDTNPFGWTAAGRIEQIGYLAEIGVIKDRNQILDMLKINSSDPAFEIQKIQRRTQQKEMELLNKGKLVEIGPEDDDAIHLDEITKVVAGFDFKFRPKAVQDVYLAHIKAHKERYASLNAPAPQQTGGVSVSQPETAMGAAQLAPPQVGNKLQELITSPRAG
jgi:hypothetical protein